MMFEKFMNKKRLTLKDVKLFIEETTKEELKKNGISNVKVKLNYTSIIGYSKVTVNKKIQNITMQINMNRIIIDYLTHMDKNKTLFRIYNTIIHEIEHIKTLTLTHKKDFYDYEHLLIMMEYLGNLTPDIINYESIKKILNKRQITLKNMLILGKYMNVNYDFSTSELKSRLISYKESIEKFEKYLSISDKEKYQLIIDTLERLNDKTEIAYNRKKIPYNKFVETLLTTAKYINNDKSLLEEYAILQNLFKMDGTLVNCYELYQNINNSNKAMYDKIIIQLFINTKYDYSIYLQDEEFKNYIENLSSKYINNAIDYIDHFDEYIIFIKDKSFLKENIKLLKKNVLLLRNNSKKYNLSLNAGTIITCKQIRRK